MAAPYQASPLFARLIPLAQEAFDARRYDTTYYLLAAALHEAEGDVQCCATVHCLTEDCLAWIDRFDPAYEHSTGSAAARGRVSIFALLARQAQVKAIVARQAHRGAISSSSHPEPAPFAD